MTRYLVLEVTEEIHDLADYLESMRYLVVQAQLRAGPYTLNVRIPPRPLVNQWAVDNHDPRDPRQVYVEEAR